MTALPALTVDVKGLAKLVERRGKSFAVLELVQNAWDEQVTKVEVSLTSLGHGKAQLVVEDDSPEGFRDLTHAFTLFANSYKKGDPEKRGRFNLGEKLVVALSDAVEILTTTGGVAIDVKNNSRQMLRQRRERGTIFKATLRMNQAEVSEAIQVFHTMIPPEGVKTTLNSVTLLHRKSEQVFTATLATEVADDEGYLRPTRRMTMVEVYQPRDGEEASIYEMGIPVVATGDRYHVNVLQKVPLNSDRDNVTPAYLRDLRALVLNEMAEQLSADDAASTWVTNALEDDLVDAQAVEQVMTKRFGARRVIFDPSDQEANRIAMSEGYTVIPGRSLSSEAWKNVKLHSGARPAGQVTPSPQPYHPDGKPLSEIKESDWTDGMSRYAFFAKKVGKATIDFEPRVMFVNEPGWFSATFGSSRVLVVNVGALGYGYFEQAHATERLLDLLIHEFAHVRGAAHLSHEYDKNLSRIGAKMTLMALTDPNLFQG